jgi:hypothetical protein
MNISAYGHKFFIFGGILLVVISVVQFLTRTRVRNGAGAATFLNPTTIRAVLFATVGLLAFLAGLGVLPMPGDK